ncbi:ArsR family transcriptional regulator [Methanomicrobium sp. W14]|uniref:ArsR/SmtB family transcription factor n=1 Tax=Methanomicrobium sp. W14 TaxID=2817839 RepID=UPI001AE931B6|nr:metalloregulator ArsR/SmtB family transcription factor [Methanomicrobium sp. W14]MBP2132527.1 ArsR family transcriptional regulator [Methanomicrobium sp. W14]
MTAEEYNLPEDLPKDILSEILKRGGIKGLKGEICDEECMNRQSVMHRACTDITRLKILTLLRGGPLCVCAIREVLGLADSKLSYHLNVLKKAGLISGSQKYRWIIYSLTKQGEIWTSCICNSKNLL